ncbi:MAG: DUF721 domain-containing protein [Xanthomonadales bacterium]|nr:DUF721 domain-containing protein [Xanthomonadales bacterium]
MSKPKTVGETLPRLAELEHLFEHLQLLDRIDVALKRALPAELCDHIRVGNLRDSTLVLITDSPIWAARLRLYVETLKRDPNLVVAASFERITVKVASPSADSPRLND